MKLKIIAGVGVVIFFLLSYFLGNFMLQSFNNCIQDQIIGLIIGIIMIAGFSFVAVVLYNIIIDNIE